MPAHTPPHPAGSVPSRGLYSFFLLLVIIFAFIILLILVQLGFFLVPPPFFFFWLRFSSRIAFFRSWSFFRFILVHSPLSLPFLFSDSSFFFSSFLFRFPCVVRFFGDFLTPDCNLSLLNFEKNVHTHYRTLVNHPVLLDCLSFVRAYLLSSTLFPSDSAGIQSGVKGMRCNHSDTGGIKTGDVPFVGGTSECGGVGIWM